MQHKRKLHGGQHEAIIDPALWEKVAAMLKANGVKRITSKNIPSERLLLGLLFDADGHRFTATHASKKGRRYCYYTSHAVLQRKGAQGIRRLPALEIEQLVAARVRAFLASPLELTKHFPDLNVRDKRLLIAAAQHKAEQIGHLASRGAVPVLRELLHKVTVDECALYIEINTKTMPSELAGEQSVREKSAGISESDEEITLICPFEVKRRGSEVRLLLLFGQDDNPRPIPSLVRATARGREWG